MNIITALGNKKINEEIKKRTDYNIPFDDIQYKDGIIELLEENSNIDLIILNELLDGEIDTVSLINRIKEINRKIEIIIFLENKNNYLENLMREKNINNIFYNNEMTIDNLIEIIKKINLNKKEINNEIEIIKQIILNEKNNKQIKIISKIKKFYNKYLNKKIIKKETNNNCKIINIFGNKKARENNYIYFISIKY